MSSSEGNGFRILVADPLHPAGLEVLRESGAEVVLLESKAAEDGKAQAKRAAKPKGRAMMKPGLMPELKLENGVMVPGMRDGLAEFLAALAADADRADWCREF